MNQPGKNLMAQLTWHARDASRRLGFFGAIGAALLVACALFYIVAVLPLSNEVAALQHEVVEAEALHAALKAGNHSEVMSPAQQLAQFYRFFPGREQATDRLGTLHSIAALHGVQLDQGTYRMVADRGGKLWRYEVTLPVRGDYPQLRKFLSQVLVDLPQLALDRVTFQRLKVADAVLEAQLKFTLFFGDGA